MARHLLKSTTSFSGMTFLSRIFGFIRDMVVAQVFGATGATDAFYVAFKIPNLLRRLFAEGSFSQAFVPLLAEYKIQRSPLELKTFVNHLAGSLALVLFCVTLVCMVCAPLLVHLFAPGFSHDPTQVNLATEMLRITFPYLFFISLTAFMASILNTHEHFAIPALTPVFLNLILIASALYLTHFFEHPILALAWGVLIAGVIQFCFLIPFLAKLKLLPKLKWGFHDAGVKRVLKLMVPALFGVSLAQISILIDTIFASFLQKGSISWLYLSERLMEFPLGVFGVALSTVILPYLSRHYAAKSEKEYAETINWAIQSVLLIGLPAMVVLMVLAEPLMLSLFHYGRFNVLDARMASRSLVTFALGIPCFMLIKIFAASFYARQNIKTPVKIAAIALLCNVVLNFVFIIPLRHAGLALASSLAAFVNAGILFYCLHRGQIYKGHVGLPTLVLRLVLANGVLALFLKWIAPDVEHWLDWNGYERIGYLCVLLIVAGVFYVVSLRVFGFKLQTLWKKIC